MAGTPPPPYPPSSAYAGPQPYPPYTTTSPSGAPQPYPPPSSLYPSQAQLQSEQQPPQAYSQQPPTAVYPPSSVAQPYPPPQQYPPAQPQQYPPAQPQQYPPPQPQQAQQYPPPQQYYGSAPIATAPVAVVGAVPMVQTPVNPLVFIGAVGYAYAINISCNPPTIQWETNLKGTGYCPVTLVHTSPAIQPPRLYACTNNHLFCLEPSSGAIYWELPNAGLPGITSFASLLLVEERGLLIVADAGNVVALNKDTGALVWKNDLKGAGYHHVTLTRLPGAQQVICGTGGYALALDLTSGSQLWRTSLKSYGVVSVVAVPQGRGNAPVVVASTYGYQWILDPMTGAVLAMNNLSGSFATPGQVIIPEQLRKDDALLFAANHGSVWACRLTACGGTENRNFPVWRNNLPGMGYGEALSATATPQGVAVGIAGKVAAVDAFSGVLSWSLSLPGCGYTHVVVMWDEALHTLIASSNGYVYGINSQNGQLLWTFSLAAMRRSLLTSIATPATNLDMSASGLLAMEEANRNRQTQQTASISTVAF